MLLMRHKIVTKYLITNIHTSIAIILHDTCTNRLRVKYIQYLEEQRTRDERNYKLLAALDRVMNKLMLISVKKDRLNALRKQYETYLLRMCTNRRPHGSITGDSGIASQNEDKYTKRTVPVTQPNLASAETRNISSPRMHMGISAQLTQPKSTSKFHDQTAVNGILLNNPPILPTMPLSAPLGIDYQEMNILSRPHVYVSPIGQSNDQHAQMSAISAPDTHQYLRTISGYDGSAPRNIQDVSNLHVSYAKAPVLSMAPPNQVQPNAVPVNRFVMEHVKSAQVASGLSATAQFPGGDVMRYEEPSRNESISGQFDPLTLFQYHDANILLSNSQQRKREYDPSDAVAIESTLTTANSGAYQVGPNMNIINQIDPLSRQIDYSLASLQKSENEESTLSLTSDDVDDLIRRNEHLLWKNADVAKTPRRLPNTLGINNANLDENDKTTILENELDRCISNIRKLHREHGVPSLEELDHEQNTSGDLLNVTMSEDIELPADDRTRKERMPEEMNRILTLANDLVSRTTNLKEIAQDSVEQNDSNNLHAEIGDKIRPCEIVKNDASKFEGKREDEKRGILAKNEIRENVATCSTELEQPHGDTKIAEKNWNNANNLAESREHNQKVSTTKKNDTNGEITASNNKSQIDDQRNATEKEQFNLVTGEESDVEGLFDIAEELTPWNLAGVQKKVRELCLDDSDSDRIAGKNVEETTNKIDEEIMKESRDLPQFSEQNGEKMENAHLPQDTLLHSEMKRLDASKVSPTHEKNERAFIEDAKDMSSKISNQYKTDESKIHLPQVNEEFGEPRENNSKKQDKDETMELQIHEQSENMVKNNECSVEQGYIEDPNKVPEYEQQDSNEQYHYNQNMPYEEPNNEEYEKYVDQGYIQEGQEYVEYVDDRYGQYQDLNNQQYQHNPDAQYEQDPNQAYDYNYDPNQGYENDQQYDPNQEYDNNPNNQTYDYTEQVSYNPDQIYDNAYEQEYQNEQHNPNDDVNIEDRKEKPEMEEALQKQIDSESEYKSDKDEDKPQINVINEGNQLKKKDVIKSLLDSDTDTTIEKNVSNTESDFDFN